MRNHNEKKSRSGKIYLNDGLFKNRRELFQLAGIGLQGWGISGDVYENLRRSMKAWRKLSARIAEEK